MLSFVDTLTPSEHFTFMRRTAERIIERTIEDLQLPHGEGRRGERQMGVCIRCTAQHWLDSDEDDLQVGSLAWCLACFPGICTVGDYDHLVSRRGKPTNVPWRKSGLDFEAVRDRLKRRFPATAHDADEAAA
jgi:hypothetical protein